MPEQIKPPVFATRTGDVDVHLSARGFFHLQYVGEEPAGRARA